MNRANRRVALPPDSMDGPLLPRSKPFQQVKLRKDECAPAKNLRFLCYSWIAPKAVLCRQSAGVPRAGRGGDSEPDRYSRPRSAAWTDRRSWSGEAERPLADLDGREAVERKCRWNRNVLGSCHLCFTSLFERSKLSLQYSIQFHNIRLVESSLRVNNLSLR